MQYFPNGSQFAVSAGLSLAVPVNFTNGNPTAFSFAETPVPDPAPIAVGDYVQIASGWGGINGRASRVGTGLTLIGIDTSEEQRYPDDIEGHSLVVADEWFGLSQITQLDKTGGEQQFFQWVYIDDPSGQQFQRPTRKSARTLALNMDYDPSLPWYQQMIKLDESQRQVLLRITLPTFDQLLYNCFVSFNEDPTMVVDQNMQNVATFSPVGRVTRIPATVTP